MELVDAAAQEAQQLTQRVAMSAGSQAFRVSVKLTKASGAALLSGLQSALQGARAALEQQRTTGKVSMKEFAATNSARQVVSIDDASVGRELERTLKNYGLTFAVEKGVDGAQVFHVQGKDVQAVEHGLSQATARIDQKIARNATRQETAAKIKEQTAQRKAEAEAARAQKRTKKPTPGVPDLADDGKDRQSPTR